MVQTVLDLCILTKSSDFNEYICDGIGGSYKPAEKARVLCFSLAPNSNKKNTKFKLTNKRNIMPKGVRLNQESFLERVNDIFKGRLDFSKSVFVNCDSKIIVTCPLHGDYETRANNVLCGYGCKECAKITIAKKMSDTQETFLEKAHKVHGDEYDYSKVEYVNNNTKIDVMCKEHGSFFVLPRTHTSGHKCPKCMNVGSDREYFIEKAEELHNHKYDYSKVIYKTANKKVEILCPIHKSFLQTPNGHLGGHGCPRCANEQKSIEGRRPVFGVGINDYDGYVGDGGSMIPSYDCWTQMLRRCYSDKKKEIAPSYEGCFVSGDWLHFDNFRQFFDKHYREGYSLDKDWIEHSNKEYCAAKCCFVPPLINTVLTKCNTMRGDTPIGVSRRGDKFSARLAKNNAQVYLGTFYTMEDAFYAYKREKESFIKELANEYYSDGRIEKVVYDAMMRYEVLIDD